MRLANLLVLPVEIDLDRIDLREPVRVRISVVVGVRVRVRVRV